MSKKEIQEKELKAVLAKDIGAKNPVFTTDHISELHALFSLYADPRQRRADVREILLTANTLGLDSKYEFVHRLIQEVNDSTHGAALDFEQFLKELTLRIVRQCLRREVPSAKKAVNLTGPFWTCRARAS
jgi:Ca2+-binding EF-hand superfamily protein